MLSATLEIYDSDISYVRAEIFPFTGMIHWNMKIKHFTVVFLFLLEDCLVPKHPKDGLEHFAPGTVQTQNKKDYSCPILKDCT